MTRDAPPPVTAAEPLARLEHLTCAYEGTAVLVDADLEVAPGDFTGIVGPSGSGKTTLLRAVMGTVSPVSGRVWRRPGLRLGYVPQVETVNWSFPVTVAEAVLMSRTSGRRLPWPSAAEKEEVAAVLERLGIGGVGGRHIRDLSGGQQQRVFLARALLRRPQLLLLDEPTSGVDVRTRHDILHLLADLNDGGLAVVLTTHDLNGMAAHLPDLVCLNTRVTGRGSPRQVLTAEILERTYGAPMEVLEHGGMPVVVDRYQSTGAGRRSLRAAPGGGGRGPWPKGSGDDAGGLRRGAAS
ncbi:MAG: metal ABC transporter ATP-binding protein [Acidimicrobiales bacterium]